MNISIPILYFSSSAVSTVSAYLQLHPSPAKQHWLGFKEKYWAKEVKVIAWMRIQHTRANMYIVQCILVLKYDQSRAAKVQVVSRLQQQTDTRPGGWGPVTCSRSRAIYKPEFSRFPAKKGHETGDWLTYSLFSPSVILPICMCQAWARHYG